MPSNRRLAVLAPLLLGTALTACGDDAPTHSASDPSEAADASVASRADAGPPKAGIDASSSNLLDAHAPTEQTEDGSLSGPDAQALTDAALPSAWDGQVADGQAADAGQDATVPAAMRVCPADALCTRPEYPCVPSDDGAGYQCRGQFASWLVAEKVAGSKAAPKYTVDAAQGVVLDEVTGLLWQRELPATFKGCSGVIDNVTGAGCSVDEAQAYCAQLPLAGKAWRLPTKIELESLLDFVTAPRKQAIDPDVFDTVSLHDGFWSASPELLGPGKNYMVRHSIGLTGVEPTDTPERVRCVHSERIADAQPQNRYLVDTQADTARDQFTHLEWQRGISDIVATFDEASSYCTKAGFRVPTYKELLTLADPGIEDSLPIDALFAQDDPFALLWSSTQHWVGGTLVYSVMMAATDRDSDANTMLVVNGMTYTTNLRVRCVR